MEIRKYLRQSPEILLSRVRLRGLISDIMLNDISRINLYMKVYELGFLDNLKKEFPLNEFQRNRFILRLTREFSIIPQLAENSVDFWSKNIDKDILDRLNEYEKNLKRLPESKNKDDKISMNNNSTKQDLLDYIGEYSTSKDDDKYYQNPRLIKEKNVIYIPCGFGHLDYGFYIHGIEESKYCTHPEGSIYALVYNFLTRNSNISKNDIPRIILNEESVFNYDYRVIYKLAILLLQLIKNNVLRNDKIYYDLEEGRNELMLAIQLVNHYAALFGTLAKVIIPTLTYTNKKEQGCFVFSSLKKVRLEENKKVVSNARELWYGHKINYRLSSQDKPLLEKLLSEISEYQSFREGQFEVLIGMLSCRKHAVCIMPTGSGKSIIYYLISLLQPLPMFIVSPTDILIKDQLRNLRLTHRFDNAAHLMLTSENDFSKFEIRNSLLYLTPDTFQTRFLMQKFKEFNSENMISYIVLDEIHCLSNWGHDFRPEYLMLSRNLNLFLESTQFLGFTATANYTIVEDIQRQLGIEKNNFFSPTVFEKFNISYDYRCVDSSKEIYNQVANITQELISRNERTLIFTKSDYLSKKVSSFVGDEASVFHMDNLDSYMHFADGNCRVLISSEELGIGLNLPNVKNIIHVGLPVSKNQYVQEIGRAGRANENSTSYVIYLKNESNSNLSKFLSRSNDFFNLNLSMLSEDNDFLEIYKKITNGINSKAELLKNLMKMFTKFKSGQWSIYRETYKIDQLRQTKRNLYMLFVSGFVNDWYTITKEKDNKSVDIIVDLQSSSETFDFDNDKMVKRMRRKISEYLVFMGNDRKYINRVENSDSIESILDIYVEWYYSKYLFHHKEQFMDFYEFIQRNREGNAIQITKEIRDFFMLPFTKIIKDEKSFESYSVQEITNHVEIGLSLSTIANIERINSNRYFYKYDLVLFLNNILSNQFFDRDRLDRIARSLNDNELVVLKNAMVRIYSRMERKTRFEIAKYISDEKNLLKISLFDFVSNVYKKEAKDLIYYGILATRLNEGYSIRGRK
jgi:superfamily II DNA/RNA helicase